MRSCEKIQRHVAVSTPGDVVDVLIEQHGQIESLLVEVLKRSGPERRQAFFTLRRLMAVHAAAEGQIIHPRAERVLANGQQVARARRDEEMQMKTLVAELETFDVDTDEFAHRLSGLRRTVIAHAGREERGEFAELAREAMTAGLDRAVRVAEIADAILPNAHDPSVEPELSYLIVGSLDAMTERAGDIISGLA